MTNHPCEDVLNEILGRAEKTMTLSMDEEEKITHMAYGAYVDADGALPRVNNTSKSAVIECRERLRRLFGEYDVRGV